MQKLKDRLRDTNLLLLTLNTFTVLLLLFIIAPLVFVVINSFNAGQFNRFPPEGFSLRWYQQLLGEKAFQRAFINSVVVASGATLIAVSFGTLASLALVRHRFVLKEVLKAYYLWPIVIPKIVLGVAFLILFVRLDMYGGLDSLTRAHAVVCFPFAVVMISASLVALDPSVEEAAADLGAKGWDVLRRIILPQIKPGLIAASAYSFIISFDQLETSLFLVRPANNTLPMEMFVYLERRQDPAIAALSTVLMAGVFLFVVLFGLLARGTDVSKYLTR